jgi:hypothetical protein
MDFVNGDGLEKPAIMRGGVTAMDSWTYGMPLQ